MLAVSPVQQFAAQATVGNVVQALNFVRQEAMRTGLPTAVGIDGTTNTVRVFQPDFSISPAIERALPHPLEKMLYAVKLDDLSLGGAIIRIRAQFTFSDNSTASVIGFDASGAPGRISGSTALVPVKEPGLWRGPWQAGGVDYKTGDWVVYNDIDYDCVSNHKSDATFGVMPAKEKTPRWTVRTQPAQITIMAADHKQDIHVAPVTGFIRART